MKNGFYLTELHCHTLDASPCSTLSAEQLVELYTRCGYDSVVLTNHFSRRFIAHYGISDYRDYVEFYVQAYKKVKEVAHNRLEIIFGAELRFDDTDNDYLWIGANEEYLRSAGDILALGSKNFREICKREGWLFIQAHPFRNTMKIVDPKMIDGVEVFNGRHENFRNEIADIWANRYGLIKISGTDLHGADAPPNGGIFTEKKIENMKELLETVKNEAYKLYRNECE